MTEDIERALEMLYYIVAIAYMLMMLKEHFKGQ